MPEAHRYAALFGPGLSVREPATPRRGYGVGVDPDEPNEELLRGGNASGSVVRVGDTVRKPWLPSTTRTIAFMAALRDRGIDLPEPRGRDDQGRLVLEYVPGLLAMNHEPLDYALLARTGALLRSIHDASIGLAIPKDWRVHIPANHPDLLCHNDVAAWNLIIDGDRLVFIDWDGAGPSTRLWDLSHACLSFGLMSPSEEPEAAASRLRAFLAGYEPDNALRRELPATMTKRAWAMHDLLRHSNDIGAEPWSTMYVQGHGQHWRDTAHYVARHQSLWDHAIQK